MCVSVCSKDWLTVSMCVCRSKDEHWENVNLFRVSFLSAWILSTNSLGKCLHTNDTLTVSQLVLNTQSMIVSLMCRIVRVYIFFTSNFSIDRRSLSIYFRWIWIIERWIHRTIVKVMVYVCIAIIASYFENLIIIA